MLACATTLCIFSVALVIGVVIVQTVLTPRESERWLDRREDRDDSLMQERQNK